MLAPQSDADVRPVEQALQALDPLLRLRWNPLAYLATPGVFDATGKALPPRYEGRWQVIRPRSPDEVDPPVVYTLAEDGRKAYKPVGWWLVDFMQRWDTANRHWLDEQRRIAAENDRLEASKLAGNEAARQEAVERFVAPLSGRELFPGFTPTH